MKNRDLLKIGRRNHRNRCWPVAAICALALVAIGAPRPEPEPETVIGCGVGERVRLPVDHADIIIRWRWPYSWPLIWLDSRLAGPEA